MSKIALQRSIEPSHCSISDKLRDKIRIYDEKNKAFRFKIASSIEDVESAARLIYDRYVKAGYIDPSDNPVMLRLYHLLPETTIFIGLNDGLASITLTLFQDSALGLPSDVMFRKEFDELRCQGRKIGEVGSLASDDARRNGTMNILMHIFKVMYVYASRYLRIDDLVIAINPKHELFYKNILLFDKIGDLKSYNAFNDAPAIAYRLNLRTAHNKYEEIYNDKSEEKNLFKFFCQEHSACIELPDANQIICMWDREKVKSLFEQQSNVLSRAKKEAIKYLREHCWYLQD